MEYEGCLLTKPIFWFSAINKLGCSCFNRRTRREEVPGSSVIINSRVAAENNEDKAGRNDNVELENMEKQLPDTFRQERKSTSSKISIFQVEDKEEANQKMWKEIARALDRIFFWSFLALFVSSSIAIYSQSGRLSSLDWGIQVFELSSFTNYSWSMSTLVFL